MINISERRKFILENIYHDSRIRQSKEIALKHLEKKTRDWKADLKTRANRSQLLIEHEENYKKNLEARAKDVAAHQDFLKSALRII